MIIKNKGDKMIQLNELDKKVIISILEKQIQRLDELEDLPTNILENFATDVKYEEILKNIIKKLKD